MTTGKTTKAAPKAEVAVSGVLFNKGAVAGVTYAAGVVLEGLPQEVAQAHTNVLDLSAEAVATAKARGAVVVKFAG